MTEEPQDIRCTQTHEWVRAEGKKLVMGITEYGQSLLSDVIRIELPEPDDHHYEANEDIAVIESLHAALDYHAPVAGTIIAVNHELLSKPELINEDPYGDGWLVELKPDKMADIDELMDIDEYEAHLPDEDEE